jgi:hypothetical protein
MNDDQDNALAELKPYNGQKIVPIVARACEACAYSAKEAPDLVCRRNPPQVTFLVMPRMLPTPQGPRQVMGPVPVTSFPIIQRDQWCGEFRQKGSQ